VTRAFRCELQAGDRRGLIPGYLDLAVHRRRSAGSATRSAVRVFLLRAQ
jgi:hypothetical protein